MAWDMETKEDNEVYEGQYTWEIKGNKLSKMMKAESGEVFESDTFEMASMNWCIKVAPNGDTDDSVGSFGVFLKLLSSPPQNGTKIKIFKRIHCKEYHSSHSIISSYKK
eukprot:528019_1